jgi:hypothetical protein
MRASPVLGLGRLDLEVLLGADPKEQADGLAFCELSRAGLTRSFCEFGRWVWDQCYLRSGVRTQELEIELEDRGSKTEITLRRGRSSV